MKHTLAIITITLLLLGCSEPQEMKIELNELTIAQIHSDFTSGKYTGVELVEAYLQRIDSINPKINALTYINKEALEQARKLDEEFQRTGKLRPLHGIPMIVKDNINTVGFPTTAGSKALVNFFPEEDAFIIKKLKDAGAIILAKSNMAEWAFSAMHSNSSTFGTTRNPYHLDYVPAGSSGGTGAAIAANLGVIGLGTDTGNSIRGPSSHNALVGFRSTLGLVSREGIIPLYLRNDVVGPMCRTVEDAAKVLEVIQGIDKQDPLTQYSEGRSGKNYSTDLQKNGIENRRIGILYDVMTPVDPEIKSLFMKAVNDLSQLGADVVDSVYVPQFDDLQQDQWCASFRDDLEAFLGKYVKSDTVSTLEDVIRIGSDSDFATIRLSRNSENTGRWGQGSIPCQDVYTDSLRIAFRGAIERTMDSLSLDALIYPTWNFAPALIDSFQSQYRGDNNQIISPHTGQPAFTVPMGYNGTGLPAGIQFLGRMYDEKKLISMMYSFEQGTMHRKPPNLP